MRPLAGLLIALTMTGAASAADLYSARGRGYVHVRAILEGDVVAPVRTRVIVHQRRCASCRLHSLPWGRLGPNRYPEVPWGGLRQDCPPVRAVRVLRRPVIAVKG